MVMTTFYMPDGTMELISDNARMSDFGRMLRNHLGNEIADYYNGIIIELTDETQEIYKENIKLERELNDAEDDIQSLHEKLDTIAQDLRGMKNVADEYPWLKNLSKFLDLVEKECEY